MSSFVTRASSRYVVVLSLAAAVQVLPSSAEGVPVCDQRHCAQAVAETTKVSGGDAYGDPYAQPLSALGGRTLAEVLSDHQERVAGPFPV